jgi:hypothetical protein
MQLSIHPTVDTNYFLIKSKSPPHFRAGGLGFVENIGVEPMTSCMPCKRSSQLS